LSEEQKVTTAKAKLPTKTKIAMWWLTVWSVAALVALIIVILIDATGDCWTESCGSARAAIMITIPASLVIEILILLPVVFLGMKRTWSWPVSIGLVSVYATAAIIYGLSDPPSPVLEILLALGIMMLIPLILIILDRKNYFKMLRQRELEKNARK